MGRKLGAKFKKGKIKYHPVKNVLAPTSQSVLPVKDEFGKIQIKRDLSGYVFSDEVTFKIDRTLDEILGQPLPGEALAATFHCDPVEITDVDMIRRFRMMDATVALRLQGKSYQQIADLLGVSDWYVYNLFCEWSNSPAFAKVLNQQWFDMYLHFVKVDPKLAFEKLTLLKLETLKKQPVVQVDLTQNMLNVASKSLCQLDLSRYQELVNTSVVDQIEGDVKCLEGDVVEDTVGLVKEILGDQAEVSVVDSLSELIGDAKEDLERVDVDGGC